MGPTDKNFLLQTNVLNLAQKISNLEQLVLRMQQQINRPTRPIYLPVANFSGYLNDVFLGSGSPALEEINSLGIVGGKVEAVGDSLHTIWCVPKDFNVDTNIKIQVVWCTDSSDTLESATWLVNYLSIANNEVLTTPSSSLALPVTASSVAGAYKVLISPYGLIGKEELYHTDFVHFKISLSAVSGLDPAVDKIYLLGILINDQG